MRYVLQSEYECSWILPGAAGFVMLFEFKSRLHEFHPMPWHRKMNQQRQLTFVYWKRWDVHAPIRNCAVQLLGDHRIRRKWLSSLCIDFVFQHK